MLKNGGDNQIHQYKTLLRIKIRFKSEKGSIEPFDLVVAKTGIEPVTFGL